MRVLELNSFFECIAAKHVNINSYGTGDRWEVAVSGVDTYPRLWLQQFFQVLGTDNRISWNIVLLILDLPQRDESNELDKLDDTFTIAQQILEFIRQSDKYYLAEGYNLTSFTEAFDDQLCGWALELQITEVNPVDRCTIDNVFLPICDYQIFLFSLGSFGPDGYINGVNINGVINNLDAPYFISNGAIGEMELTRFRNDLEALGYTVSTNYTGITFTLIIFQTQDEFVLLDCVADNGKGGVTGFNIPFTPANCIG